MNIFDQKFRLLHLLKREDITGMKNSVEYRLPYLDVNFINWANALGEINKLNKDLPKKDLSLKQKKDFIHKTESIDTQGAELVYALIRAYQILNQGNILRKCKKFIRSILMTKSNMKKKYINGKILGQMA